MANARRYLPAMPITPLFDHPDAIAMPAAAFGALSRLCIHFWATGCQPLSRDTDSMMAIARAHRPTWSHHKVKILSVFDAIAPEMTRALNARRSRSHHLVMASQAATAARKAARVTQSQTLPSLPAYAMDHSPKKAPPKPARAPNTGGKRLTD